MKSEGDERVVLDPVPVVEFDRVILPEVFYTITWSFYPGFALVTMSTPAPAPTPGTTIEFVGKGIVTEPRVTVTPAP